MFAGQISGCEGYVESANVGMSAGYFASCFMKGKTPILPPVTTATGAMLLHLRDDTNPENYQPMNINFGIFPTIQGEITANGKFHKFKGNERKEAYAKRALKDFDEWKTKTDAE